MRTQMTPITKNKNRSYAGGALALAAVAVGGFALTGAGAQGTVPVSTPATPAGAAAPAVKSPAVQSAAAMQTAFGEVARTAEPAVVTITTSERQHQLVNFPSGRGGFGQPGRGGDGDNSDEEQQFRDFLRQFRQHGMTPNALHGGTNKKDFRLTQGAVPRRPSAGMGALVETGLGSGVIYDPSGLILTNAHVVQGADRVSVKLLDGRVFKDAKVLGIDKRTDIAVVKIPLTNAPSVTLGDSSRVNVGDWAIAVGNPYGLSNTMTVGVISATAREVPPSLDSTAASSANDYLQTDASINPGNSGGALLDIYGRVVGINNAIYSRSGGNVGIGFAIPINVAKQVAASLVKQGYVSRARIGVGMGDVSATTDAAFGLPAGTVGALVNSVEPGTPAARAGVQIGDVITAWNGETIARSADLQRKVTMSAVGQPATMTVLRGGKTQTLTVTPVELDHEKSAARTKNDAAPAAPADTLGVVLEPLTPENRTRANVPATVKSGVLITAVQPGSPAARAGIEAGSVITRVGQTPVNSREEVNRAKEALLKGQTGDRSVALYVVPAEGLAGFVVVTIGE